MKVGVVGCNGRVGSLVMKELQSGDWSAQGLEFAGACGRKNADEMAETHMIATEEELFREADVVIDFTLPEGTRAHAKLAAEYGTALVVGTTGLTEDDEKVLQQAAEKTVIIYAANMSVGVNMLLALVEKAARPPRPRMGYRNFRGPPQIQGRRPLRHSSRHG